MVLMCRLSLTRFFTPRKPFKVSRYVTYKVFFLPVLTGEGEYIQNCTALVAAIAAANPGDTILMGSTATALNGWSNSGTYIEMSPEMCGVPLPLVIDKSITIRGAADQALYNVFTTHNNHPMFLVRQNGFTPVKLILESLTFMEAYVRSFRSRPFSI